MALDHVCSYSYMKDVFAMRAKRPLSLCLAAVLAAGLITGPAQAAFPDVTDPVQIQATDFLQRTGVIAGLPDGTYAPGGTLTRAEFCKMAIAALGRADQESAQRSRTIYMDVPSTHWARGFVNLASTTKVGSGDDAAPLVQGPGDGNFYPDRSITYAEAVAILCRVLGRAPISSGGAWYEGYMAAADAAGLTDGLSLAPLGVLTRGQAAQLFYNLYFAHPEGSSQTYLESQGGSEVDAGVILSVTDGVVKATNGDFDAPLGLDGSALGCKGKLLLDAKKRVLAFQPDEDTTRRTVDLWYAEAAHLVTLEGERVDLDPGVDVYYKGSKTTWEAILDALPGSKSSAAPMPVTLCYGPGGSLKYLFFPASSATASSTAAVVFRGAPGGSDPFKALAGDSYALYKNGMSATLADLRQYDTAICADGVVQVSDRKLTGVCERVSPSPTSPLKVWVMGCEFDVLTTARAELAAFELGDKITLLLTADGKVACVLPAETVSAQAVGQASVDSEGNASVKLLQGGLTVKGTIGKSDAERFDGQLVSVTQTAKGKLSLKKLSGAGTGVSAAALAPNAVVYDRAPGGAVVEVDADGLPASIPAAKVAYRSTDYAGRVDCLVLEDVTGDAYAYGFLHYTERVEHRNDDGTIDSVDPATLCVRQANADGTGEVKVDEAVYTGAAMKKDIPGGLAWRDNELSKLGGYPGPDKKVVDTVELQAIEHVGRDAFDLSAMTVTVSGRTWPIAEGVQCWNAASESWISPGAAGVKACRAYSDDLTLYYDRAASEGGKIRMIVIPE